jgi:transposase
MMQRRKFNQEFKLDAVKLIRDRDVVAAQAGRDLGLHENVLRKWVREARSRSRVSVPGNGRMKPQQEIERLRCELARMKAERDILKNGDPCDRAQVGTFAECNFARGAA